jgi:phosphoribosylformylglycinamidine cyclo-ligase
VIFSKTSHITHVTVVSPFSYFTYSYFILHARAGLYPKAFCKIVPDYLGGDPDYCNVMHADGAGPISSLCTHLLALPSISSLLSVVHSPPPPPVCSLLYILCTFTGTKSALAYIYWKETGDLSVWTGIAQDALIMNIDDLICVGLATRTQLLSAALYSPHAKLTLSPG